MDASDHIDGHARDGLIRQLAEWAAERPRTYAEAMETWGSQCPALAIWEDALAERLIAVRPVAGAGRDGGEVRLTPSGRALIDRAE
ncbi:MAG TPA: hypothetical protein VLI41_11330 [Phenylobacterium sp.]|uniref:hypothetical protein n=1 Tax=Phenylobacterium sp. TaxID=1871053 RepID=UPI002CE382AA|nr:hypothetical protein [Phenylobacterium sp.]HSV03784.1 hypothetical protein [Phenylobacterium sp.]